MFGYFEEKQEFINEHSGILIALLVSWSMKQEKCFDLIVEISEILQKDMALTLEGAFFPIYLQLNLYDNNDIKKKGMDFLLSNVGRPLY